MLNPSGEKIALVTSDLCAFMLFINFPVLLSHILIVLSPELETIYIPSSEKLTYVTLSVCSFRVFLNLYS